MSLPNWFYPILMVWLAAVPGFAPHTKESSSRRSAWLMLMDTFFLLPWIMNLFLDEPLAAWVGVEVLALILLFDLLARPSSEAVREAWIKFSMSWFLSWLFIGTAVALSGVHPIVENLFYPLPTVEVERFRPVLAGSLFLIGLCLKFGLPPFQQGFIDIMDATRPEDHRRWSLQLRLAALYGAWQLMPSIFGGLGEFNQHIFCVILTLGCLASILVAGVQASVQRSLAYMGNLLFLPVLLQFFFMDAQAGIAPQTSLIVWVMTVLGFLTLGWLYQDWPRQELRDEHNLLWSDADSPCALPGYFLRLRVWTLWCIVSFVGLAVFSALHNSWLISLLLLLVALSAAAASSLHLGMACWKQQNQGF